MPPVSAVIDATCGPYERSSFCPHLCPQVGQVRSRWAGMTGVISRMTRPEAAFSGGAFGLRAG